MGIFQRIGPKYGSIKQGRMSKKTEKRFRVVIIVMLCLGVIGMFLINMDLASQAGPLVLGTIESVYQTQSQYNAGQTYLIIKLDQGRRVKAHPSKHKPFQIGKRIILREYSSKVFQRRIYIFIDFIDTTSKMTEEEQLLYLEKAYTMEPKNIR